MAFARGVATPATSRCPRATARQKLQQHGLGRSSGSASTLAHRVFALGAEQVALGSFAPVVRRSRTAGSPTETAPRRIRSAPGATGRGRRSRRWSRARHRVARGSSRSAARCTLRTSAVASSACGGRRQPEHEPVQTRSKWSEKRRQGVRLAGRTRSSVARSSAARAGSPFSGTDEGAASVSRSPTWSTSVVSGWRRHLSTTPGRTCRPRDASLHCAACTDPGPSSRPRS
jgi:hypothetical protein